MEKFFFLGILFKSLSRGRKRSNAKLIDFFLGDSAALCQVFDSIFSEWALKIILLLVLLLAY